VNGALAGCVVVHYGEVEPTARCVASLLADPSAVERLLVVVDNLGNLEPESLPAGVDVLRRPENPGFGAAVNAGVGAVDPDSACTLYLAVNNDTIVRGGFLEAAAGALEVGVGAAGGPVRVAASGEPLWYAGGGINFLTGTVRQKRSEAAASKRRDVGYIPATALAVAPLAWREIGGFDRRYFLYNEDLDLCLRLRRAGWRLRFEPGMACEHRVGGTTGSAERSPMYLYHLTRTRLRPFRSQPYRVYLAVLHTAYNAIRLIGLAVGEGSGCGPHVAAVARGHREALWGLLSRREPPGRSRQGSR
jgi:GT2 family glycosyltransferase